MITSVSIRDFQSLKKVDVDMGRFTVIVGSSSSGKSAFVRALRALVSNVRGSDYVTRGAKQATIRVHFDDGASVTLERGDGTGAYVFEPTGEATDAMRYTKLGGAVPEDISNFLRVSADLCFSQQFDSPYLLTDSGTIVARSLGELTNVSTIFSAAREGNRVRLNHSNKLKVRQNDLSDLLNKAQSYKSLNSDLAHLARAEEFFAKAEKTSLRLSQLREMLDRYQIAQSVLSRTEIPEAPTFDKIKETFEKSTRLRAILEGVATAQRAVAAAEADIRKSQAEETVLSDGLQGLLVSAGVCPTCGTRIEK